MSYPKQPGSGTERGFNGWKNRETWNVALWISNDENLYKLAKSCSRFRNPYEAFLGALHGFYGSVRGQAMRTPDGVRWDDDSLDIDALNKMIGEL